MDEKIDGYTLMLFSKAFVLQSYDNYNVINLPPSSTGKCDF